MLDNLMFFSHLNIKQLIPKFTKKKMPSFKHIKENPMHLLLLLPLKVIPRRLCMESVCSSGKPKRLFYLGFRQSEQTCIDASIKAWGYCISTQVNHPLLGMHSAPRNRMCVSNVISVVLGEL